MRLVIALLFSVLSTPVFASVHELAAHFNETFDTHYAENRCGDNVMRLIYSAKMKGIDIQNARIIEIENGGFSAFGMVNAEWARESGKLNPDHPQSGRRNLPGERNWYHHIVLEMDGYIFDYSFGNDPWVLGKAEYFEKMFLDEQEPSFPANLVGRENKLKTYRLTLRNALATLAAQQRRQPQPEGEKIILNAYLAQ